MEWGAKGTGENTFRSAWWRFFGEGSLHSKQTEQRVNRPSVIPFLDFDSSPERERERTIKRNTWPQIALAQRNVETNVKSNNTRHARVSPLSESRPSTSWSMIASSAVQKPKRDRALCGHKPFFFYLRLLECESHVNNLLASVSRLNPKTREEIFSHTL